MTDTTTSTATMQTQTAEQYIHNINASIQKKDAKTFNELILSLPSSLCDLHQKANSEIARKQQNENHKTVIAHPLMMAVRKNCISIIEVLLKNQKEKIKNGVLFEALDAAAGSDKTEIVEVIVSIFKDQILSQRFGEKILLQRRNLLPEIKFILDPKSALTSIEKDQGDIDELFQIIRHLSSNDDNKELYTKDFYACLENKLVNTIKTSRMTAIQTILNNQDLPVTLFMVAKAFQTTKKEMSTCKDKNRELILSQMIELFDSKIKENEKNVLDVSLEHDLDEVFALALKMQPLEKTKVVQLFNEFKINNKVAMQQKLLESEILPKECVLQTLDETANKQSQNAPFFDFIISAEHHKETVKEFIDSKLATGAYDIVHRILLASAVSLSQSEIIAKMKADHKKKIFFLIRNPELIKVLLTNMSITDKFDVLLESFNDKNYEKVLTVYNHSSIGEKTSIWSQFQLTNPEHKALLDNLLLTRPSAEMFKIIERMLLDKNVESTLVNMLLAKLDAKQLKELAGKNSYFKDVVHKFIASLTSLSPYPYEMVKKLLEISPKRIVQKEMVEQLQFKQKLPLFFKGVSEEELNALLESHLKLTPQNAKVKGKSVLQKTLKLFKDIKEEEFNALVEEKMQYIFLEDIIKKMNSIQKMSMLFKGVNEETIHALLKNISTDDKVFIFEKYSTEDRKEAILNIFAYLPSEEKSIVLSQLITERKNNLFPWLMKHNIDGIIEALVNSKEPKPKLAEAFLQKYNAKEIASLIENNSSLKDAVIEFLDKKLASGDMSFVATVFASPLKNLKREDLKTQMTDDEKVTILGQITDIKMLNVSLAQSLPADKKIQLVAECLSKKKNEIASAIYNVVELKEKVFILSRFVHSQKFEWINFLMPKNVSASVSLVLLNLPTPPSILTNKLLDILALNEQNMKFFTDCFKVENKLKILAVYKSLSQENKTLILLALIKNEKSNWADYLVLQTLEESTSLILKEQKTEQKLVKILFALLATQTLEQFSPTTKNNILAFMVNQLKSNNICFLNDDVLMYANMRVLFQEAIMKRFSSEGQYKAIVNFAKAGCDNLVNTALSFITIEQKLKLLNENYKQDGGIIVKNVYKHIPLEEMATILLAVTKQKNIEQMLFIINSFYIKSEQFVNARTGKLKQLLNTRSEIFKSSPTLKADMLLVIKEQFTAQAYCNIGMMLLSPLREIIQEEIISSMSEKEKFDVLISAANKNSDAVVRFFLEQIKTPEQRFNFFSENYSQENEALLSVIFKAQDRDGDLKIKRDIFAMAVQNNNLPLIAFIKSIDDMWFKGFFEKVDPKNGQHVFLALASYNQIDWLKSWLLENIEENCATVLSLYKAQPQEKNQQKLMNILLEVLPAKHLVKFVEANYADMTEHARFQLAYLRVQQQPLSVGVCNLLQFMTEKDINFAKSEFIEKMSENGKFSLLLVAAKNTTTHNRKELIRLVLDCMTVEQKRAFVEKYIGVQSYRTELSHLYLYLTSEEMVDIFDKVLIKEHDKGKKRQSDWMHAIEFEKVLQDKQHTIMLAEKKHPLLTIAMLKLLSAQERTKLFTTVDADFALYLQECMNYDVETYKMFLAAAKQNIGRITDAFVKDDFLKANLLTTAKVQGHQDVIKYINNGNKGKITSVFKKNEESPVNNPAKALEAYAVKKATNEKDNTVTNSELQKIFAEYVAKNSVKAAMPQNQQITKPVNQPSTNAQNVVSRPSPEQQKLLENLAAQRNAIAMQSSPRYTPGQNQQNQQKQEDPRYTPSYVQQQQFTTQLPFTSHVPLGGILVSSPQFAQLPNQNPALGQIHQSNHPQQQAQQNNAQGDMVNSFIGSLRNFLPSAWGNNPPPIQRVQPPTTPTNNQPQQPSPQGNQQQQPPQRQQPRR